MSERTAGWVALLVIGFAIVALAGDDFGNIVDRLDWRLLWNLIPNNGTSADG